MSMLSTMSFPRWMILTCALATPVLGWFAWQKTEHLDELEQELAMVPTLVREIQTRAIQLDTLQKQIDKDKLGKLDKAELYIQKIAQDGRVNIGDVNISPDKDYPTKGVVDYEFLIKPSDQKREYNRHQIANFLFKLEEESRRVRVTRLEIEPSTRRVRAEDVLRDAWTFEVTATSRQKEGE